jgi:BNR repeat-containing family member
MRRGQGWRRRLMGAAMAVAVAGPAAIGGWHTAMADTSGTVSFADDFQRPDGPVGSGWVALRGAWAVASGAAVPSGATERVLARASLFVGSTFDVSASVMLPATPGNRMWAGVAVNIVDHGDGTQTYYALRVAQDAGNPTVAQWQLVRIDRSAGAGSADLLTGGGVGAMPGTAVSVRLRTGPDPSSVVVSVAGSASSAVKTTYPRRTDLLTGGRVGLYSNAGATPFLDFQVTATTGPALVSFGDNFDRADGAVGPAWQVARGGWSLAGGSATASGPAERVMYARNVTLGATFTARASLTLPNPATTRLWAGLALNVVDHGDGTQTYYALRIGQSSAEASNGNTVIWQLVKVTRSSSAVQLLGVGTFTAAPGTLVHLTAESRNRGTGLDVSLSGAGVSGDHGYAEMPFDGLLSGARVGLYALSQPPGITDFSVDTTTTPADPPTDPGPLMCDPTAPADYTVPGGTETVAQVVNVDSTWSGYAVGQAILTTATDQYVAYYDANRTMTVGKRSLSSTTWTFKALGSVLGWDSHNYLTMALDSTGNLHVAGNMHAQPLVYFRTTTPGDISTLVRVAAMVDPAAEAQVTYPRFLTAPDGRLLFGYRAGASGGGSVYYDVYDTAARTWSEYLSTPLIDGEGTRSGYDTTPALGPDGYWHEVVLWRDTVDAGTSSMPSYMRSRDLLHWEDSAGNPVALPARYRTMDVVDPVPTHGGAINTVIRYGFDARGLIVVYLKYDENLRSQLFTARPNGLGGWSVTQLTRWSGRWNVAGSGTLPAVVQLGRFAPLSDGNLRLDFVCNGVARTLIVEPATMRVIHEVPTPQLPADFSTVRSTYPGMQVQASFSNVANGRYGLRWESLPGSNDRAGPGSAVPPAQPLQVYLLTPAS